MKMMNVLAGLSALFVFVIHLNKLQGWADAEKLLQQLMGPHIYTARQGAALTSSLRFFGTSKLDFSTAAKVMGVFHGTTTCIRSN